MSFLSPTSVGGAPASPAPSTNSTVLFSSRSPGGSGGFVAKATRFNGGSGSGQAGGRGGSGAKRTPGASAASSPSAIAPWKSALAEECLNRVKANRAALMAKIRDLPTNTNKGETSAYSLSSSSTPFCAVTAAAHASLASSLRGIIDEQLTRSKSAGTTTRPPPANIQYHTQQTQMQTQSRQHSSSGVFQSSAAVAAAAASSASFTALDDEFSSTDYESLMAQLQDELLREYSMELDQSMLQDSSHPSEQAIYDESIDPDEQLMAQVAEFEADQYGDHHGEMAIPCPCCHRPLAMSNVSPSGTLAVVCSCGLCYPCASLVDFSSHLSSALELHQQRCASQPRFLTSHSSVGPQQQQQPRLALACERCQTWITMPVHIQGWQSNQNSQQDEDTEMGGT